MKHPSIHISIEAELLLISKTISGIRLILLILMVSCLLSSPADAFEGDLQKAEEAFKAKRYGESEQILIRLANRGNAEAASILGALYMDNRNEAPDYLKARKYLEQASSAGRREAMYDLAWLLDLGLGGVKDHKRAVILRGRAADLGLPHAQFVVGVDCLRGTDTKQDFSRALKYLKASARTGNGSAECLLAFMYEGGIGVSKNLQKAASFMKAAKSHGCADGEYEIGKTYLRGLGFPKDYAKAQSWLTKAAEGGNEHAMNDLGIMYAHGTGVELDDKKALFWQLKAVDKGCPTTAYNVAERYRTEMDYRRI